MINGERVAQIKEECKNKGMNISFYWSNEDAVGARRAKGWDYYYEIDDNDKTKAILKRRNGQIVIAKMDNENKN